MPWIPFNTNRILIKIYIVLARQTTFHSWGAWGLEEESHIYVMGNSTYAIKNAHCITMLLNFQSNFPYKAKCQLYSSK